jgi:DNA (cytosine-5)-methyltransferase 1
MYKAISLFTGAGGLDLGFEAAGFHTAVAVEMDRDSVSTLRHNRDWSVLDRSIHDISSQEIMNVGHLSEGDADVLIGGPPCQPFSKAGYWANGDARRLADPRATTLEAYLRVLRDLKPKTFLLENVAGLAYQSKNEGVELLRTTVESINRETGTNYSFQIKLLNAAEYGIPQSRERVFIVGHRDGLNFVFPEPTHQIMPKSGGHQTIQELDSNIQPDLFLSKIKCATCVWDAIGDLEDDDDPTLKVKGKWAHLLPSIPEGCNYLYHTERGDGVPLFGWRRRYWSFLLKLAKSQPAWTIQAQPGPAIGPFHWKNRRLSMKELCRIQTFPDNYYIQGGIVAIQKQLGNAVPSAMAEVLARAICQQFLGDRNMSISPSLAPKPRRPLPLQEKIQPVHHSYLHLQGEHSAHPGTGRGYGAQKRNAEDSVMNG